MEKEINVQNDELTFICNYLEHELFQMPPENSPAENKKYLSGFLESALTFGIISEKTLEEAAAIYL
jgi:hypothetical protein